MTATVKQQPSSQTSSSSHLQPHVQIAVTALSIQSIALFVNGAARAAILPYAPILVYQISKQQQQQQQQQYEQNMLFSSTNIAPSLWPDLALRVSILVALCSMAHSLGSNLRRLVYHRASDDHVFGAVIGLVVVFLAYSTGANSYTELLLWRSLASLAAGIVLCTPRALPTSMTNGNVSSNSGGTGLENIYKSYEHIPIAWLLGFATTVLLGGLLFDSLRENFLFRLVSTGDFTYSFVLLIVCVLCGSILVPKWCTYSAYNKNMAQGEPLLNRQHHHKLSHDSLLDNDDTYDVEAGLGTTNTNTSSSGMRRRTCSHSYNIASPRVSIVYFMQYRTKFYTCTSHFTIIAE